MKIEISEGCYGPYASIDGNDDSEILQEFIIKNVHHLGISDLIKCIANIVSVMPNCEQNEHESERYGACESCGSYGFKEIYDIKED